MQQQEKCVSPETARKLKEAGFPQSHGITWGNIGNDEHIIYWKAEGTVENPDLMESYFAPDVSELLKEIDKVVDEKPYFLRSDKINPEDLANYWISYKTP